MPKGVRSLIISGLLVSGKGVGETVRLGKKIQKQRVSRKGVHLLKVESIWMRSFIETETDEQEGGSKRNNQKKK